MRKIKSRGITIVRIGWKSRLKLLFTGKLDNVPVTTILSEEEYDAIIFSDERFLQLQNNLTKLANAIEQMIERWK